MRLYSINKILYVATFWVDIKPECDHIAGNVFLTSLGLCVLRRVFGCPRAGVGQTAKELDGKSPSCSEKRLAKPKNRKRLASGSEDSSSDLSESRQFMKRVTRHNVGGSADDGKVSVSRKGTVAALMGGKRAGTSSSNELRPDSSKISNQSTRRMASEKQTAGNSSNYVQRKAAKTKRTPEETAESKSEGGSPKRRRIEDGSEGAESEVKEVKHGAVEEEVLELSEIDICEDEPASLDDDKKTHIQETQQSSKLTLIDSVAIHTTCESSLSASSQRAVLQLDDKHADAEESEKVTQIREEAAAQSMGPGNASSENINTTEEVAEEHENKGTECHGDSKQDVDSAATLPGKSEECLPSLDAGCQVFSGDDDVENLIRTQQSWPARRGREDIETEPTVEQMEVEEEITVEGGGVLLVEASTLPKSERIGDKVPGKNNERPQTQETVVASSVDEVKAAYCERTDDGTSVGRSNPSAAVESLTADRQQWTTSQSSDVKDTEISEEIVQEETVSKTRVCFSSSEEEPSHSKNVSGAVSRGAFLKNSKESISSALVAENAIPEVGTGGSDVATKSSTDGILSDVNKGLCYTAEQGSETVPFLGNEGSMTRETTQAGEQRPRDVKLTAVDSDAASTAVPQDDDGSVAAAVADQDASSKLPGETACSSAKNAAEASPSGDEEVDHLRPGDADTTDTRSPYAARYNAVESQDGLPSSEAQQEADASSAEVAETGTVSDDKETDSLDKKVSTSSAASVHSVPAAEVVSTTSGSPTSVSVVAARTLTTTVAGSEGPAVTSVVGAGPVPAGFMGMPPLAIRAAVPGSAVGSVFVHVADPRQFAMHVQQQQQQQQQGQIQGQAPTTPMFHIPALSPQQGGAAPQLVMSPLSPQQVALLSSSMPAASSQPPHQLIGGVPPRHVTLVTSGPRPQLLQQCLLTSSGPQPLALLSAAQPVSASKSTTTAALSTAAAQPAVSVQQLAILSHALQGAGGGGGAGVSAASTTTAPSTVHQQPVALFAAVAGPNQTPVMRMAPAAAVIPRHPMSASSAMQHLSSAVQTISLQQLQLSFAAAAAAAQQQQQQQLGSSAVRSSIPIQRLPVLGAVQPSATSSAAVSAPASLAVVSVATAPVVSVPVSPMVSAAASALTAFLKKESVASQLLQPPATALTKLSPHDVALKGIYTRCFWLRRLRLDFDSTAVRRQFDCATY